VVFAAAGILTWGANFPDEYVHDELASHRIFFFPDEASLREEGRDDPVKYADGQVTTGSEAEVPGLTGRSFDPTLRPTASL